MNLDVLIHFVWIQKSILLVHNDWKINSIFGKIKHFLNDLWVKWMEFHQIRYQKTEFEKKSKGKKCMWKCWYSVAFRTVCMKCEYIYKCIRLTTPNDNRWFIPPSPKHNTRRLCYVWFPLLCFALLLCVIHFVFWFILSTFFLAVREIKQKLYIFILFVSA